MRGALPDWRAIWPEWRAIEARGALCAFGSSDGAPSGPIWRAIEARGPLARGDPLPDSAELLFAPGDRGLAQLIDGVRIAVGHDGSLGELGSAPAGDLQLLPAREDSVGRRPRPFHVAAAQVSTTDLPDWRVRGPRIVQWLLTAMSEQGHTPRQRHFWWRQVQGLWASDLGVDDHLFLSDLLEVALTVDHLNLGELGAFETAARRYQLWEEVYAPSVREAEGGKESSPWLDERQIFLGHKCSRGHALVCPDLETWVAERLREESSVLKERRKGREERALVTAARFDDRFGGDGDNAHQGGGDRNQKRGGGRGGGGRGSGQ